MTGPAIRGAVVSAAVAGLLWPVVAWADKTIEAGPPNRFTTPAITIDQGEPLTFRNGDTVSHDVTASATGSDGKPLFATPIVPAGRSAFVEGSQYLTEGTYPFVCTLHNGMKGTLNVTGAGTPQTRPGEQPAAEQPASADKVKPRLRMRIASRSTAVARVRGALVVRVDLSEPSRLVLKAVARPKAGGPLVVIARRVLRRAEGVRRVRLKLTRAGVDALSRDRRLAVIVNGTATDAAGNVAMAVHGRTLAA